MALRLMIVETDPEVLKLIRNLVEPLGYEALAVTDSREAAQRVNRQKFDGILLNGEMPDLDGYALTRHIRASPSNGAVPIAMLTDAHDAEKMREGFKAGVTFFLGKPADDKKLRGLLKVMHGAMVREKRGYVRVPVRIAVEWKVGSEHLKSTSLNISERGMLVELAGDVAVGEEADLHFVLPEMAAGLKVRARVVRRELPYRVAVQFVELRPEVHEALREFIAGTAEG